MTETLYQNFFWYTFIFYLGGFIAFFTMATIVVLLFTNLRVYGILIAFLAAIVEILPLKINDNLTVPIVSGYLFMIIS